MKLARFLFLLTVTCSNHEWIAQALHSNHGLIDAGGGRGLESKGGKDICSKASKKSKSKKVETSCESLHFDEAIYNATVDAKKTTFGAVQTSDFLSFVQRKVQQTSLSFKTTEFLWFAWEVKDEKLPILQELLPSGFNLSKISIKKGEERKHYIVLNLYNVNIAGNLSIRAEWSTFVNNASGSKTPYFMILDAPTNAAAFEPTQCAPKDPVPLVYNVTENNSIYAVLEARGGSFTSSFRIPCVEKGHSSFQEDPEFNLASDHNYWLSGVYDKGFWAPSLLNAPLVAVATDEDDFFIKDDTFWSTMYKSSVPDYVWFYLNSVDFTIKPWYNLDDIKESDPPLHACLDAFKFGLDGFAGLAYLSASNVVAGTDEPLLGYSWKGKPIPTTYLNFDIHKKGAEEIEKIIPANFELVKTITLDGNGKDRYTMTVRIGEGGITSDALFGTQVEMIVYVKCKSNPENVYQMVVESKCSFPCLRADDFAATAVEMFNMTINNDVIDAEVKDDDFYLSMSVPFLNTEFHHPDVGWLESHERKYFLNGVYDYYLCDKDFHDIELLSVDPKLVQHLSLVSKWFEFVEQHPFEVFLLAQDISCTVRNWYNLYNAKITAS